MTIRWKSYPAASAYDELVRPGGQLRASARKLGQRLAKLDDDALAQRRAAAELAIQTMGITFTVYSQKQGASIDRAWPFDIVPRVIPKSEWDRVEEGLKQRVQALNMFIDDIYHGQKIVKDGVFPKEVLAKSRNFRPQCVGIKPPLGIWAHICGSDLVRDGDGRFYVLEDNLRVPSGVSYMLENRQVMKRVFPGLFENYDILPIDDYPSDLREMLESVAPGTAKKPEIVVLTPGIYNSAYFEHAYLAQQMGAELVEGTDLFVDDKDRVFMRTVFGPERVHVIYRRIDDLFLDPEAFNPDSMLGVPGLMRAWKKGNVTLVNAPGAGVADDKVVYGFVPDMIRYYLDQDAIIPNVPTYMCMKKDDRDYVLANLDKLVVKPANESGGYGMLIGPQASKKEQASFARKIRANPREYIGQPMLTLSTVPTLVDNHVEPRHVDLRPFILSGKTVSVTMGGLTRVALVKGSTVVNSSQGGGSKDTWIVDDTGGNV
ncbi:MAG: circularly permuted type 2 ATP-grasp protein [Alphaproteobacteria bacterium]|nr:circularly permuted type 2 ATP-grasp protein [Alphaproteobacteria bacterium]